MGFPFGCLLMGAKQRKSLDHLTADWLAQLVEHWTAVREVAGSNLGRTNTQGL